MADGLLQVEMALVMLVSLLSVGGTIYNWFTSRSKDHSKQINQLSSRIHKLEVDMKHVPSQDDVQSLKISVTKQEGAMGVLTERTEAIQRSLQRVENFLIENKT